jgi:polysaccharide deacetylase 2 family uncharacterized protein YibQ
MADELSAPLSRRKRRSLRAGFDIGRTRLPVARIALSLLALILVGAVLRIMLVSDPEGGRPSATVAITSTRDANPVATGLATSAANATAAPASTTADAVAAATPAPAEAGLAATTATGPAAVNAQGVIPELAEATKNGPIPRMGPRGRTPFAAYSRPATPIAGKPMVAIVVTGLGLNEAGTLKAVDQLPPDISLAFAPYGKTLATTVAAARAAGHELLLEAPFEPFDYPDTDPGPQTLLTGQPARANLDKLYWLMARFGGYIGLINHTGARFTASATDFGPVMEELGTRGLGYLDDGSSNRSIAPELAQANKVPFGRADVMLDANPARGPILAALDALVAKAVAQGQAIGVISALPVSIETVSEWAGNMADRYVQLVPVSALMH